MKFYTGPLTIMGTLKYSYCFSRCHYLGVISICDILRDIRKSPKKASLAILYVMKSAGYGHQNHRVRVFRQSLSISQRALLAGITVLRFLGIISEYIRYSSQFQ